MVPTFEEEQRVQLTAHRQPKRFDVVVFQPNDPQEPLYIKRVIGLPGEEVSYHKGQLFVQGALISDNFAPETDDFYWSDKYPQPIPTDCYFVMGDNRQVSKDSRTFGWISKKQIIGIVREDNER